MTDQNITVGHPFYFPTQVVLLDDDPDFLEGVSLMLDKNLSFKLFQSVSQALDFVNKSHTHVKIQERCYSNYKTGPSESDSLSHIDIDKIHLEVLNSSRFETASTVIVDYSMPEMNGLEFLLNLKNPFIKKVLLTGQADTDLAIKAFNKQLIDQFIDKHDPKLRQKLNSIISTFQEQYFRNSFKLISDPIIANNRDAFLVDSKFQEFFEKFREKFNYIEYYMIDSPRPGFLMIDEKGNKQCLLVFTGESVRALANSLRNSRAPAKLISQVESGELLPDYYFNDEDGGLPEDSLDDLEMHFHPAIHIGGKYDYSAILIPPDYLTGLRDKPIITYAEFLEANSITSEVLH